LEVCSFKYNLLWDDDWIPPSVEFDTAGSRWLNWNNEDGVNEVLL
jgi:hypothetical protein